MENYYQSAVEKLSASKITGQKQTVMAALVADTLRNFCDQNEEFAQAVSQGGSFQECMNHVAKGVGQSISDFDAYKKAVQFYFPGAEIRIQMRIDLIGDAENAEMTEEKNARFIVYNLNGPIYVASSIRIFNTQNKIAPILFCKKISV